MATKTILVDDIDGSPADETIEFSLDGSAYSIDLSSANAEKLRESFAVYIGHATAVRSRAKASRQSMASRPSSPAAEVREWAAEQGIEVSSRGRIPSDVLAAYEAALR